jgi:hypothetical protein
MEGVPGGLSMTPDGHLVLVFPDTKIMQLVSVVDDTISIVRSISLPGLHRPLTAVLVHGGEENGFLVRDSTDDGGLPTWFLCGHRLEGTADPSLSEEPIRLRSLDGVNELCLDQFGSYVALNITQSSVELFDSAFARLRQLVSAGAGIGQAVCITLDSRQGRVAIGQSDGVVAVFVVGQPRGQV